ncbi:MAG: primosomal protein N' [Liquorilactobacillus ghanensis]|uniref:primosomal protein N' n=1 Tax=Liquorilactobacillus ghanensis TaxID=399370 RepID=UPI0039E9A681
MQVAAVIVDVPARQTDRPFSYVVGSELSGKLTVGMRVIVPFGRGNRLIQGFVVEITEKPLAETSKLKKISEVQDLTPVLNPEMLALADWLAATTFSFKISCLQTMIPNGLRGKSEKIVRLLAPEKVDQSLKDFFGQKAEQQLQPAKLSAELFRKLQQARNAGSVELLYQVKDQARPRQVRVVQGLLTTQQAQALKKQQRANAHQLLNVLDFLAKKPQINIQQQQLEKQIGVSAATIRTAAAKQWLKVDYQVVKRSAYDLTTISATTAKKLTSAQQQVYQQVAAAIQQQTATSFLLEGVTGSGKTEIYLQLMAAALAKKQNALLLVPEISLTPQMVAQVVGRFGKQVALLHSGLSVGERLDEWRRIENGSATIIVGARSAVFAPIKNLGIIILDEEHESSYAQDNMPRYHARDVALWRSRYHHCPVVLGSATPSLESRARAQKGVYHWLQLPERINTRPLPAVSLVDMRQAAQTSHDSDFSNELLAAIKQRLVKQEQIILLLNRRGYATFMMCRQCGFVLKCPNCDISLTLHKDQQVMKCHYCGHEEPIPRKCPACGSLKIRFYGTGTQKIQEKLQKYFATARILRMDVDTTRRKGAHQQILQRFGRHQADILLGTQMIAKGLDYPDVTLVGVLNADTSLSLPDFRASEQTFQLLTQVSGRAGRAEKEGKVIIQTFNPQHYALQFAKKQDYEKFYAYEMRLRHQGDYPPYYFTIQIAVNAVSEPAAIKYLFKIAHELKQILSPEAKLLGPVPQMILRIKNHYRYHLIIKFKHEPQLLDYLHHLLEKSQQQKAVQLIIIREPTNFM